MGFVRFRPPDAGVRPGYRYGNVIVDLPDTAPAFVANGDPQSAQMYLKSLDRFADEDPSSLDSEKHDASDCSFAPPVSPPRLICLEGCYEHDTTTEGMDPHFEEANMFTKDWPSLWAAPASAYVGPSEDVRLPSSIMDLRPGVELGLVINRHAKGLDPAKAGEAIAGVVVVGHLISHDNVPRLEGHRMFDTAFQLGAEIVPRNAVDVDDVTLTVSVDGSMVDQRSTAEWRFTPAEMVAQASSVLSLNVGDVVLTGDPTWISRTVNGGQTLSVDATGLRGTGSYLIRDGEGE